MSGYPDGPLGAKLELLLGTDWTDVTRWAVPDGRDSGQLSGGQPDGSQQASPGSLPLVLDNADGRFSPGYSAGPWAGQLRQNTPARLSFASPFGNYLRLEGDSTGYASCPDSPGISLTGNIDVRIDMELSDSRPSVLASKWGGGTQDSWALYTNANGTVTLYWVDSSPFGHIATSSAALPDRRVAVRATVQLNNGAGGRTTSFYYASTLAGPWAPLGTPVTLTPAVTALEGSTAPLIVGYGAAFTAEQQPGMQGLTGRVYGFELYDGIGGTLVAQADFTAQAAGASGWTDGQGNTWTVTAPAEVSDRDYRLHGELSVIAPTAQPSGSVARVQATAAGRMRRLQQGKQPTVESPLRRAIRTQAGSLFPVWYAPMEESSGSGGTSFAAAVGGNALTASSGTAKPGADSSFEASAPLPLLNGAVLSATVPAYTGASAWAFRFPVKLGGSVPAGAELARVTLTGGACATVKLLAVSPSGMQLTGLDGGGGTVFTTTVVSFPDLVTGMWVSMEATPSGGSTVFAMVAVAPGATSGTSKTATVSGTYGTVTGVAFNTGGLLTDTVIGHAQVQKAWVSMFSLGSPLDAWRTELAADRFARVCAEQGIPCRILGRPASTQAMGAQPRGNPWAILQDCANTEQGFIYEPRDVLGLGLRTAESLGGQQPAVLLSFALATLRGDLQPSYDDVGLVNDVQAATTDGASFRAVLDDGSPRSVSEFADGGAGDYAVSPVFNLAAGSQLAAAAALYLAVHSVNEPRYRNVACDLGIPGAPAAAIARLRPGDLIWIDTSSGPILDGAGAVLLDGAGMALTDGAADPPGPGQFYADGLVAQLAQGWKESFGPGRAILLDCVPASPYG